MVNGPDSSQDLETWLQHLRSSENRILCPILGTIPLLAQVVALGISPGSGDPPNIETPPKPLFRV